MDSKWKYKIGSGKMPVILMLLMSVIFGGLTLWLHSTNNGAVVFLSILTVVSVLIFLLTIYRYIFYKVLIGANGFYYQTSLGNGKYYAYTDVEKAWINSGRTQNGAQEQYCNIAMFNKKVIRFSYFYNDEKSVEYLLERVNVEAKRKSANSVAEKDEYLIDGKFFGKTRLVLGIVILAILSLIEVFIIKEFGFIFIVIPIIVLCVADAWLMFNYYLFFRVEIGKDGFYCRTDLFNRWYYKYNEIVDCRKIKRVVRHGRFNREVSHRTYHFYFEFTDSKGKKHKFRYEQPIHEYEVDVLKERIETAQDNYR